MRFDIDSELRRLAGMTVRNLRERYAEVFGEPTRSGNKDFLVKRIAWRVQANATGGLSQRARQRAAELACDAEIRRRWPTAKQMAVPPAPSRKGPVVAIPVTAVGQVPRGGTVISRVYKGRQIAVTIRDGAFEYDGESYRSLSAVARKVTGSHWNGRLFFGLSKPVIQGAST